ncbi:alpha/beta hydrolase [Candidatus Gottesmanbacteria bacterium]|nr:alpha/beta hydrolase [Candidatus Gottesmanbacteria bacterium]
MKNAIILHGGPSKEEYYDPEVPSESNAHWLPWLQGQLLKHDIAAATPEVPHAFDRVWSVWNREVERFEIGPDTILVGHSTGAGFFVKYLSIHKKLKVKKVILVAPFLDPDRNKTKHFFDDFEMDPDLVGRTQGVTIFNSDNDEDSIQKSVSFLREKVKNIKYREFHNYGHFCYEDMKTTKFPELLEEVLAK